MCRNLITILLFCFTFLHGQDSINPLRLGLYDCTLYTAFDFIENEKKVNLPYIQSFSEDKRHAFVNLAFPDTVSYSLHADQHGETDGGEFGINLTFRFKDPGRKIFSKVRPRIAIFYSYRQFFSYNVNLSRHFITDTFQKYSASSYILRDSVLLRNLKYSYYSEQLYLQLGFNYEVVQRGFFSLYSGLLGSGGVSFRNEFSTQLTDQRRSDLISSKGARTEGQTTDLLSHSIHSKESVSHSFRLGLPLGFSWRFLPGKDFSLGFNIEGRLAVEHYQIDRGRSVSYLLLAAGAGIRFSFYPHRRQE